MMYLKKNKFLLSSVFLISVLFCFIIVIFIMSSVPPVSRDALTHHLVAPKLFIEHGGLYEKPTIVFSYYPMNMDLLYVIPLYFNNDIAPKYIHFFFALLTALFIYKYLKEHAGHLYGLIGVIFFLSLPVIIKLSVTVYVDLGLIFFSWGCLYWFLKWYSHEYKIRYLVFAALFCGLALGTKYNGLVLLFIISALTPLVYSFSANNQLPNNSYSQRYRNSLKGLLYGFSFVVIALLIFSPWMVRNYQLKRNPVYPLYNSWFNSSKATTSNKDLSKGYTSGLNHFERRRYIYKESLLETTLIPLRIFFQGRDDNPKYFDGKLNPFLLFLPFFAFWRRKKDSIILNNHFKILATFVVLFIFITLFTVDMRIRYIAPVLPPLVVLSVFGLKRLLDETSYLSKNKNLFKIFIAIAILCAFFLNGKYLVKQFRYINPLSYIMKKVDRETYITRYRPEYPVIKFANQTLPDSARVLCLLIGNRTYYIDCNYHLNTKFFHRNFNGEYTEEMLLNRVYENGTSHIILDMNTFQQWVNDNLNQKESNIFTNFFKNNTKILYEKYGYQLFECHRN